MSGDLTREWCLIHAILQGGHIAYRAAHLKGIKAEHLGVAGSEERKVWELFDKFRFKPSMPSAVDIFHLCGVTVPTTTDSFDAEAYAVTVVEWALYQDMAKGLDPLVKKLHEKPREKREAILEIIRATGWVNAGAIDSTNHPDAARHVREAYEKAEALRKSGKLLGFSSPWPSWDEASCGIEPGKFLLFLAKREMGKTMLTLAWVNHIWENDLQRGDKILYVSMEMDPLSVKQRLFAIRTRLDYAAFRKAKLTTVERDRFFDFCDELEKHPDPDRPAILFAYSDQVRTIDDVATLVAEHQPKLVVIDGIYIMGKSNGREGNWERITNSAKDAKLLLANAMNVPVIATSQFTGNTGRDDMSADADSAAYAKAMSDYADIVIGVVADEQTRLRGERVLKALKTREFQPIDWKIRFKMDCMDFSEIGVLPPGSLTNTGKGKSGPKAPVPVAPAAPTTSRKKSPLFAPSKAVPLP